MYYENREEKSQQNILDNRQRIYNYIKNNPGFTSGGLARFSA